MRFNSSASHSCCRSKCLSSLKYCSLSNLPSGRPGDAMLCCAVHARVVSADSSTAQGPLPRPCQCCGGTGHAQGLCHRQQGWASPGTGAWCFLLKFKGTECGGLCYRPQMAAGLELLLKGCRSLLWVWAVRRGRKLGRFGGNLSQLTKALQRALVKFYYISLNYFFLFSRQINF